MKFYGNILRYVEYFDSFMVQKAIEEILDIISKANKYIDIVEPWKLFKEKEKNKEDLDIFIYTLLNIIRIVRNIIKSNNARNIK
jgi:methionine--tRNA ligase